MVNILSTEPPKKNMPLKGTKENAEREKKSIRPTKTHWLPMRRRASDLTEFDRVFEKFRRDLEDTLWPSNRSIDNLFSRMPMVEIRVPKIDMEDRGKDYLLKAEMPGFSKEDINLEVTKDSVEIQSLVGWKYDDKTKDYVCKERECESFYRMVNLPEEIDADKVSAKLQDGILEIVLTKKAPKEKKKISVS